jgi:predicted RNA-binding Zn-ribbon protein involved in translation (DUF1610 family)
LVNKYTPTELQTYISEQMKKVEDNVSPDVKKLHGSGAALVMECPACGKKTAKGKVDRYGIVELSCESCGWSGSIGFG